MRMGKNGCEPILVSSLMLLFLVKGKIEEGEDSCQSHLLVFFIGFEDVWSFVTRAPQILL